MKQHITVDHLNELANDQKKLLWEWWRPQIGDMFVYDGPDGMIGPMGRIITHIFEDGLFCYGKGIDLPGEVYKKNCLPLLSIGQCIEFLASDLSYIDVKPHAWQVAHEKAGDKTDTELIDALWEAVKSQLK